MTADRERASVPEEAPRWLGELTAALAATEATDGAGARLELSPAVERTVEMLLRVRAAGRTVLLIGNGGSAAIVGHVHNDLSNALGIRALTFTEPSALTCIANDHGYGSAYEQPTALWAQGGDVLVAVSSSGRSENILRAARVALDRGARIVTFTGFGADNPLRKMGTVNFWVPSRRYGHVEVAHQALAHLITDCAMGRS
jgi:D-sedoheptulose 7-phosphate isomerase